MSIWGEIGSAALTAYGAYSASKSLGGVSAAAGRVGSTGGMIGRAATGLVAGAAGYLAGSEGSAGGGRRHRRGRGLTAADLRGFRRTVSLLKSVGMVPRKLHVRGGKKR
jgi:hypothetical protein